MIESVDEDNDDIAAAYIKSFASVSQDGRRSIAQALTPTVPRRVGRGWDSCRS